MLNRLATLLDAGNQLSQIQGESRPAGRAALKRFFAKERTLMILHGAEGHLSV